MKELAALQRAFQRHVCRPGDRLQAAVVSTPRASAARRLSVYADAYRLRLIEALGKDFPALLTLLGQATFERLGAAYVAAHPSRTASLRWYGAGLAGFLARSPQWRRRPLLAELARFEWALGLAFDAADAPVCTAAEVAGLRTEQWPLMRLQLHPSVQLLRLRGNAPRLWQAVTDGQSAPAATRRARPAAWLVWRKGQEPYFRSLQPPEAWALSAVARGCDFTRLTSGLRRHVGSAAAAQTAAQLLRNWLAEDLISAVGTAIRAAEPVGKP